MHMNNYVDELAYFDEEITWRKSQERRDFGREILETMSYEETQEILTPLMEARIYVKASYDKKYKQLSRIAKKHYAPDTFEYEFAIKAVWALKFQKDDIENQVQLEALERYWKFNESRKPLPKHPYRTTRYDFEALTLEAKQVPIESLIKSHFRKSGRNSLKLHCLFHQEKTPSLTIFTDTNTFYCFGCKAQGDAIAFYQKVYGVDFVEAVKRLTNQY